MIDRLPPAVAIIGVVLLVVLYFLPVLIAASRSHHNIWPIAAVNLLLGWTALGWIGAMVWSLTATDTRTPTVQSTRTPGPDTTTCPYCAEDIKKAAVVCRYCGHELKPTVRDTPIVGPVDRNQNLMNRYGIKLSEDRFLYQGQWFDTSYDAVKYAQMIEERVKKAQSAG